MEKIKKITYRSVQNAVYMSLRKNIMNLNLFPGTAISEKEMSLRYQVSRTPVREAFIHLAKEGLVQVIPQKETIVSLIDFSRVEQEWFLRTKLEMAVIEPFMLVCNKDHLSALETLIYMQQEAFEENAYVDFLNYDDDFHRAFFEVSGQDLSWEVMESMGGHYHRVRLLTLRIQDIAKEIIEQHRKILAALHKRDLEKTLGILSIHLHKITNEEKLLRERFPTHFASRDKKDVFDVDFS
ncbi:MAG: GntR family transcriptional regulator [Spirochaetaceae bacterium]|jgi:DNA-binding GntR family transcriptional regulator|nr:GntR family transcriptional regulator [Spirochaetaceae bacterium]